MRTTGPHPRVVWFHHIPHYTRTSASSPPLHTHFRPPTGPKADFPGEVWSVAKFFISRPMARSPAWTRSEGKDPDGGLNAKGRASYNKQTGGKLKPPAPNPKTDQDASRRKSFCARMTGMRAKNTSAKTAKDPNSRINKSLRAWKC